MHDQAHVAHSAQTRSIVGKMSMRFLTLRMASLHGCDSFPTLRTLKELVTFFKCRAGSGGTLDPESTKELACLSLLAPAKIDARRGF